MTSIDGSPRLESRARGAQPTRLILDGHHATMDYINGAAPSFKGLPLPEGVDRHNLYTSAFRVRHPASDSALSGYL